MHKPDRLEDFPASERFWEGGSFTFLGSGIYFKKILFIGVKVCPSWTRNGYSSASLAGDLQHQSRLLVATCRFMRRHCMWKHSLHRRS